MDIFDFIKTIDLPIIVIDNNSNIVCVNGCFNNVFGLNAASSKFQQFKNSFSIQSCMLYPENIVNYNPISLAIEAKGNFETIATYQKSNEEYMTFFISSSEIDNKFIIKFFDLTNEYRLKEINTLYNETKNELNLIKKENVQYLETKEKAQNQAIKMALLNRLFEALRKSIELNTTLNHGFKELSDIFGFSKVIFAFPEGFKPKKRGIFLIYRQIMRLIELMLMKKEKFILAANILI